MFLNFTLHESLQAFCGVDLTPFFPEDIKEGCQTLYERWCRCLMGCKVSPFQTIKAFLLAEEIIRGNRRDPKNPFWWERVQLNLPGEVNYNPRLSWIAKLRVDDKVASDFFTYVDDIRTLGSSEVDCWIATR